MGIDLKLNGEPETYSDYLSEDFCILLWELLSLEIQYDFVINAIDKEIEEMCDECERGDCDDCQREPQINEGHL